MGGVPLGLRGATSYQRAYASCRARHTVDVTTRKGAHVSMACAADLRPPPAYFTLAKP
jgi:hypothetical protein